MQPILRWGPGAYFQPDPPTTDHAGLTAFLEGADFYEDGDCLYATDGDRLFAFSLAAQEWTQLTAWPPGRRLAEIPRTRFEAMFGAALTAPPAERWQGADPTDRHHMLVLSLLAQQAVQGGHFCEVHIPADPGPALYLLMTQADWTAVLAGGALSLANACEVAPGEVRLYRFVFNAGGLGELAASLQTDGGWVGVYHGGWHRLATRVVESPAAPDQGTP